MRESDQSKGFDPDKMSCLKYVQGVGFVATSVESPHDESPRDWLTRNGFGPCEEADGTVTLWEDGDYESAVEHFYNDDSGARATMVNGVNRWDLILTENDVDFFALRVLLAPLALTASIDAATYSLSRRRLLGLKRPGKPE